MQKYSVKAIGQSISNEEGFFVQLFSEYKVGLKGLQGFSHLNVLYWFDQLDSPEMREILETEQPYKESPKTMGTFAIRGPIRPNPIAFSVVEILAIDEEQGLIQVGYLDAEDGSPILDLKPYTPSMDRVEAPTVPVWCEKWPKNIESSGDFDWASVFNFE
ncbi:tRNA (N6-threonylcarbamoyladenosine(37)-N6)-methyltransferase TrmO [Enterococcus crotali]|uniref:tRNA (N6-threonylcarbamoyladenosine(37)-N6)-methyltransferase TrmO n=1 Tax=Enterococcus crotali TaxID=1453587 RepID=UPI0004718F45|nr:tRNA (N6-threonylcarbamoyladenosine(37)-N6)-methyltransferase TrmO [Enterococcus crotali]OTP48907.1 hypothetical protein A5881_002612 [Enterococcus termitis]